MQSLITERIIYLIQVHNNMTYSKTIENHLIIIRWFSKSGNTNALSQIRVSFRATSRFEQSP